MQLGQRILATLLGLAVIASAGVLRADPLPLDVSAAQGACVSRISDRCVLRAQFSTISLHVQGEAGLNLRLVGSAPAKNLNVGEDIADQISKGEMVELEGTMILEELNKLDGAIYKIPAFEELIKALGFPRDLYFSDDDFDEFIRIHMQMSWGIQPLTAMYVTKHMKLETVNTKETFVQIHEEPTFQEAVTATATATAPAPVAAPVPAAETVAVPSAVTGADAGAATDTVTETSAVPLK